MGTCQVVPEIDSKSYDQGILNLEKQYRYDIVLQGNG